MFQFQTFGRLFVALSFGRLKNKTRFLFVLLAEENFFGFTSTKLRVFPSSFFLRRSENSSRSFKSRNRSSSALSTASSLEVDCFRPERALLLLLIFKFTPQQNVNKYFVGAPLKLYVYCGAGAAAKISAVKTKKNHSDWIRISHTIVNGTALNDYSAHSAMLNVVLMIIFHHHHQQQHFALLFSDVAIFLSVHGRAKVRIDRAPS